MKRFRVISDMHIDVNERHPIAFKDADAFTVVCGDTSGYPRLTSEWIKNNCINGVGVSGNHLPYNDEHKTIQQLRQELSKEFPKENSFTYLDCETDAFYKEVDGILFIGSCMYTDMHISHPIWNPNGDKAINMRCSALRMNDYKFGIKSFDPTTMISPNDYFEWFNNAYSKIEAVLDENEAASNPKDVVLVTHHPLITDFLEHNGYVESHMYSLKDFIWSSYASDMKKWLERHSSIKCYCCGHIHDVYEDYRSFDIARDDGTRCLVVNNARGYVNRGHDTFFNPYRYVDVDSWTIVDEIDEEYERQRKERCDNLLKNLAWFM